MQKTSTPDQIVQYLEKIIDLRFQYLREKDYENFVMIRKINEEYKPLIEEFKTFLDEISKKGFTSNPE